MTDGKGRNFRTRLDAAEGTKRAQKTTIKGAKNDHKGRKKRTPLQVPFRSSSGVRLADASRRIANSPQ
ncbi:MAG: hypothetical protein LLG14_20330, partial [Nocardiaceae bacterium]|nr:hypothetical protein [Nocardiaceae bacterium]